MDDITARSWDIADILARQLNLNLDVVIRLINMVEKDQCTIPFIARYRKEQTNGMDPDSLRNFTNLLNELRLVQKKCSTMIKTLQKQGNLDKKTQLSLQSAQTTDELDHAFAPFKEKKSSLANRARELGLDEAANSVLSKPNEVDLRKWVVKRTEGRSTLSEVETGVKYIIADLISKEKATMDKIREVFQPYRMQLESKLSASKKKEMEKKNSETKKAGTTDLKHDFKKGQDEDITKYQSYHDFICKLPSLKSYQVLAINRGEAHKHLTVKVTISKEIESKFLTWSKSHWTSNVHKQDILNLLKYCVEDSYNRLIKPFVLRKARSDLTKKAREEAVDVFSRNLKKLLLTPPLRGKIVLGVDPGFKNGCKCAVISSTGNEVLETDVIYLGSKNAKQKIQRLYGKHKFSVIAIGNGTACRESESFFSQFITKNRGSDLVYCIVNENGASIYSVTTEAQKELPDLDPNLRSAVSIARRLQDPLVELVKIEPKHIGVGMYQHDIPDTLLKTALGCVIEDCVTFVGVDLNIANESLLGRIAGLKKTQVKKIIEYRNKHGHFINRKQLLEISGLGEKTFQQCAGFIRISHKYLVDSEKIENNNNNNNDEKPEVETTEKGRKRKQKPSTAVKMKKARVDWKMNPLDQTWIHPESYELAEKFITNLNLDVKELGKPEFINNVKHAIYEIGVKKLADKLSAGVPTLQLIADGLSQDAGFRDIRSQMRRPLFRRGITSMQDLRCGTKVSGRITNVTDFGVFVDVGVGQDGLIHMSEVGGRWEEVKQCLGPNDTVEVLVKSVDSQRKRVSLRLIHANLSKTTFV
ncbi:S1 RNA-binding domain-containing protein 1-like [Styela clava]